MRDLPSPTLLELLEKLRLATPSQVRGVARNVRRLAGELPHFDSVWIDALAQDGLITPYQAQEVNAGRGEALAVGPYVVRDRKPTVGYAENLLARDPESDSAVRLLVVAARAPFDSVQQRQFAELADASRLINASQMRPIIAVDVGKERLWAAADCVEGTSAAEWMVENGRFPPMVVLHLARQMLIGLCELERLGLVHGDLHAHNLWLAANGAVAMSHPGLRPIVRPNEGLSQPDLPAEAYESLAPERVVEGTSATTASELFACGCVWWHLLTGRPAITGGNSLAKIRNAAISQIVDVRQLAPDAPPVLAEVIAACVSRDPAARPRSIAEVANILGPPSRAGASAIAKCIESPERWLFPHAPMLRKRKVSRRYGVEALATAACVALVLGGWWMSRGITRGPKMRTPGTVVAAAKTERPKTIARKSEKHPKPAVIPTSFVEKSATTPGRENQPLRLPVGRVVELDRLTPRAGQLVCGQNDERVTIAVPAGGLVIDQADVRFKNIDFVARDSQDVEAAMIVLTAPTAEFTGCSFQSASKQPRAAIAWQAGKTASDDNWEAAADQLRLSDCVFYQVDAAIIRQRKGDAQIDASNVLLAASGSFARLPRLPKPDEAISVSLDHCTFRESGGIELYSGEILRSRYGRMNVIATDSVFEIPSEQSLISLQSADEPTAILAALHWSGHDSLIGVDTPLLGWHADQGPIDAIDEATLDVAGIIRSRLTFAGKQLDDPTASRLRRWQAPRQSPEAPGVSSESLFLPSLAR